MMTELEKYYNKFNEEKRLKSRHGQVEFITSMKYIHKYLPKREHGQVKILDVGAGTGRYSVALAEEGYDVTAVELVKYNLGILKKKNSSVKAYQGNALKLSRFPDKEFDLIILFGPMYHLYTKEDKVKALEIAHIRKKECPVVWNEKIGYWKLLKDMSQQQQCKEFVSKKIDALIQYDKENESDLIETLEALVNHLGARNITATSLYLHRNTLMYRIKKIENLTGYDLSDPESILELSLALRLNKFMNH